MPNLYSIAVQRVLLDFDLKKKRSAKGLCVYPCTATSIYYILLIANSKKNHWVQRIIFVLLIIQK